MRNPLLYLLFIVAIITQITCTGQLDDNSWMMERQHPSHRASLNDDPPEFPLTLKWKVTLEGPMYSSPIINSSQGNLYIGSDAGKFWALNPTTGVVKWVFEADDKVRGSGAAISVTENDNTIREMLFMTSSNGTLYSLDPSTGEEIWHVNGNGPFVSSPNYSEGKVFYLNQTEGTSSLRAINANSGEILWESSTSNVSAAPPSVGIGSLYLGLRSAGRSLYAINPNTGVMRQDVLTDISTNTGALTSGTPDYDRPVYDDECQIIGDRIYISTKKGTVNSLLIHYDAEHAVYEWETQLEDQGEISGFSLTSRRGASNVLVVSQPTRLSVLNTLTGNVQWDYTFQHAGEVDFRQPQPAIWGNFVFHAIRTEPSVMKVVALSLSNGTEHWSSQLDAGTYSSPAIAGDWLYISDTEGTVYAYSGEHGTGAPAPPQLHMWVSSYPDVVKRFDGRTGIYIDDFATADGAGRASDLTFGPDGNLYVSFIDKDVIKRFNGRDGEFMDDFVTEGSGGLNGPSGVRFGPDHNLYVSSMWTNQVKRYDGNDGTYIDDFVSTGGLFRPSYMFFWDDLYVSSTMTNEIKRYDDDTGEFVETFISMGSGGLASPLGFVFQPDGYVYVVSGETDEIKRYNAQTGAFVDNFVIAGSGGLDGPNDLQFVDDYLYVTSYKTNEVKRYDGNTREYLGNLVESCNGGLYKPGAIRVIMARESGSGSVFPVRLRRRDRFIFEEKTSTVRYIR